MSNSKNFQEYEEQQELEEDIGQLDQSSFSSAVVSANDWTTETLLNQINKGNIQLNPDFQRRDAWDKKRKSKFIESLILGLPIPQVVLAESKERRGAYIVLDGKQRLLSIRQFASDADDEVYEQLKLTGLEIREDLKRKSLQTLKSSLGVVIAQNAKTGGLKRILPDHRPGNVYRKSARFSRRYCLAPA